MYERAPMKSLALLPLLSLSLIGCVSLDDGDTTDEQDSSATTYVDIFEFSGTDQGAWYDAVRRLTDDVTQYCKTAGACGAYANTTAMTFRCAVSSKIGSVHDCNWTFGASNTAVDPTKATLQLDAPTFQCHSHPKTSAAKLSAFLATATHPLTDTLPGGGSLADGLADCFAHPIGATAIPVAGDPNGTYVSATDYYKYGANAANWQRTVAAVKLGFDNICGDTFCGGDMSDLQSLEFQCSVTRSTGNIKSCAWVFSGSLLQTDAKKGIESATSQTFRCNVTMHGNLSQFMDVINVVSPEDPIHRALPGMTTSAYDALGGCLP